ncbi:helix-turn-helix transcriptional regulator [Flavobacterium covae]|uniref:helix-turn-helix transcriptional regulator n=1 Tax=Flavobacterium covae TaxID=2906076 RepID=UPI000745EEFB|nr:helix-turn-helix domain-containing protein [Flavobacterium covae]AMA49652.1 hypothetical protein AWN65_09360 [Flavobacterium covae]MCJ1809489.1 helix-turn-helix domain-containing protein [Flavobacterium covae]OXA80713.1 DNA-binding protein [Flavobacterium columnare] [Flavobacterium columnare NBRC 100251 = ATCC 23463]
MLEKTNQLLVQLSVGDLQQLIKEAVKEELTQITSMLPLAPQETVPKTDLLSREETAKMLGVSTTTLFLWNRDAILKAKKIGRRVYYFKDEVLNKLKASA